MFRVDEEPGNHRLALQRGNVSILSVKRREDSFFTWNIII